MHGHFGCSQLMLLKAVYLFPSSEPKITETVRFSIPVTGICLSCGHIILFCFGQAGAHLHVGASVISM